MIKSPNELASNDDKSAPRWQPSTFVSLATSAFAALIVVAGILLRLHDLTRRDLWVDEASSVVLARLPWKHFWQAFWDFQANMGLYYFLLRGWLHFGDSEATVRGMSVLFGVAVIPATYLLATRLFGRKAALASAALSAINVFQIRYSQEARAYSLVMLLAVLATYFFVSAVDSPNRKRYWFGYVLTSALGIYAHLFVYLVIAAHWLSLGYARLRTLPHKALLCAAGIFLLLTAPMDVFLLLPHRGLGDWVPRPTTQMVLDFAKFFTGDGGVLLLGAYAVLCLTALWPGMVEKPRSSSSDERWSTKVVAWWLLFPIVSTLLVSLIKPVFFDRFMGVSAAALTLLAGQGMAKLDRMWLRPWRLFPASLLVMVGLSGWGVHRYEDSPASQGDNWQAAIRFMLAGQQPGDAAFLYRSTGAFPLEYYAHREIEGREAAESPVVVFPLDVARAPEDPDEHQAQLAIQGQKRIWLILQHNDGLPGRRAATQAIQDALQEDHRMTKERVFPGTSGPIRVLLYVQDSSISSTK